MAVELVALRRVSAAFSGATFWRESHVLEQIKQSHSHERTQRTQAREWVLCDPCTAINQNPRARRRLAGVRPGQAEQLRAMQIGRKWQRNERQGNGTPFWNLHSAAVHSFAFAAGSVGLRLCRTVFFRGQLSGYRIYENALRRRGCRSATTATNAMFVKGIIPRSPHSGRGWVGNVAKRWKAGSFFFSQGRIPIFGGVAIRLSLTPCFSRVIHETERH